MPIRGSGLLWAEWRRTRKVLGLGLALQASGIAYVAWRQFLTHGDVGAGPAFFSFAVALCVFLMLLFSQSSAGELQLAIPQRCYLLPISAIRMTSWWFFYRLAVLLATTGLATATYALTTGRAEAWFLPLAQCAMAFSALQTLVWMAPWVGAWTTYLLAVFALGPAAIIIYSQYETLLAGHWTRAAAISTLCVAAAFVLSCLALRSLRSGRHMRNAYAPFRPVCVGLTRNRSRPFSSQTEALSWYEWRNAFLPAAIFFSGLLLSMIGLLALGAYLEAADGSDLDLKRQWMNGLFLLLSTTVLARFWMGTRRVLQYRRRPGGFINRQPLDDMDLALGRIAGAAYAVMMWCAALVGGTLALSLLTQWMNLRSIGILTPVGLLWAFLPLVLLFTWVAYWQGGPIVAVSLAWFGLTRILENLAPASSVNTTETLQQGLMLATVLTAAMASISFVSAYRRRLLSARALCQLALGTAGVSGLGVSCLRAGELFPSFSGAERWAFCGALSLLAMSPFATAPLAVFRARHR